MHTVPRPQFRTLAAVSTLIGLTVLLHYSGLLRPLERFFRSFLTPASTSVYQWSVTINDTAKSFSSVEELQEAYVKLSQTYQETLVDKTQFTQLQTDNEELRKQLGK